MNASGRTAHEHQGRLCRNLSSIKVRVTTRRFDDLPIRHHGYHRLKPSPSVSSSSGRGAAKENRDGHNNTTPACSVTPPSHNVVTSPHIRSTMDVANATGRTGSSFHRAAIRSGDTTQQTQHGTSTSRFLARPSPFARYGGSGGARRAARTNRRARTRRAGHGARRTPTTTTGSHSSAPSLQLGKKRRIYTYIKGSIKEKKINCSILRLHYRHTSG